MKRRRFLASTLALAGLPQITTAQAQAKVFRIGWISGGSAAGSALLLDAFRAGMANYGYVEGRNLVIEARYADDDSEQVAVLAQELSRLPLDLLATQGAATRRVVKEIGSIPIVYVFSADPVLAGIAQSLARPGGNATGISLMSVELNGKRIELIRELLPRLSRITVIANPAHSGAEQLAHIVLHCNPPPKFCCGLPRGRTRETQRSIACMRARVAPDSMASMRSAREGLARSHRGTSAGWPGSRTRAAARAACAHLQRRRSRRHPPDNRVRELLVLPRRLHVAARRRQPERAGNRLLRRA